jgi:hypothetical protein
MRIDEDGFEWTALNENGIRSEDGLGREKWMKNFSGERQYTPRDVHWQNESFAELHARLRPGNRDASAVPLRHWPGLFFAQGVPYVLFRGDNSLSTSVDEHKGRLQGTLRVRFESIAVVGADVQLEDPVSLGVPGTLYLQVLARGLTSVRVEKGNDPGTFKYTINGQDDIKTLNPRDPKHKQIHLMESMPTFQ